MKKITLLLLSLFLMGGLSAQDIQFTFADAQNTNDGSDDFYEVDVLISTVNTTGSFKLGSGQLYFNYSAAAFGTNVSASGSIEVITDFTQGYIAGQPIDAVPSIIIYSGYTLNDNTETRVSWAFSQTFASSTFAAENVTDVPVKLCRLKLKYADVSQAPMVSFEDGSSFDDQFFTACGPDGGGATETANCGDNPGVQLVNDSFDSSGASLSNQEFILQTGLSLYPTITKDLIYIQGNTQQIEGVKIFNLGGQQISNLKTNTNVIDFSNLSSGVYLVKIKTLGMEGDFKVIKE